MIFGTPKLMKCGHYADCIMSDVPYNNEKIKVAACSFCFKDNGTVIQPACNMAEKQPTPDLEPVKIDRDYNTVAAVIFGTILCFGTIIALIVSM